MMKKFINSYFLSFSMLLSLGVFAHDAVHHNPKVGRNFDYGGNPRGIETLDFQAKHISRVVSAGYPVSFGVYAFTRREKTQYLKLKDSTGVNRSCIKANFLAFDVDDNYAFDINEDVNVELLVKRSPTNSLAYGFDQHGSEKASGLFELNQSIGTENHLMWVSTTFSKARFANRGINNTDFVVTTNETMQLESRLAENVETTFILCDVKITRSKSSVVPILSNKIEVNFNFADKNIKTPVKVGLYNSSGTSVLLDKRSLVLPFYEDKSQQHSVPAFYPPYQFWPHANRYFYYIDGGFSQQLPPDTYTLFATKGPEYRISKHVFTIEEGEKPVLINVDMKRWLDLPSLGWYSGDVHIHVERAQQDNQNLTKIFKAEDVHFSNLLEMSTNETNHFSQYSFGDKGTVKQDDFAIVPGIEGPRTAHRGHAIALNVKEAYKQPDSFFLYHEYFKHYQQQKSVIGYAHVGSKEFNASWGLALDMPFDLIDFVEIMQNQRLRTGFWYEFLNLGFKLAPAAGSDYPYFEHPGAVRSYVKMTSAKTFQSNDLNIEDWYQQLKGGNTFVSNLPFIEIKVNDKPIGSRLAVKDNNLLTIEAKVSINTDYDKLLTLELIHCGKVIKKINAPENGSDSISFNHQFSNASSGWLALRAKGKDYALAHTGAIYLEDKQGQSVCKEQAIAIIDTMQSRLKSLKKAKLDVNKELEYWEATKLEQTFNKQKKALEERIGLAVSFYHQMKAELQSKSNLN